MPDLVKQVKTILAPRSRAVEVFLNEFLPKRKPPEVSQVIREFIFRGGKRLRAALVMLGASVVEGDEKKTVPLAAAIELFHAFTLIHDDIMDESELRRGRPCVHRTEGAPIAMNAADAMGFLVLPALQKLKYQAATILQLQEFLWNRFQLIFEGQAEELSWIRSGRFDVAEREYFSMVEKKTAVLIGSAVAAGAFLGGGQKREREALYEFGRLAGIAFQIRDDILNLVGEEAKYQKEIGGDITEGKRSLITIHALKYGAKKERIRLQHILRRHTRQPALVGEAIALVKKTGSIVYAQRAVEHYTAAAFRQLTKLPRIKAREELETLAKFLLTREQ